MIIKRFFSCIFLSLIFFSDSVHADDVMSITSHYVFPVVEQYRPKSALVIDADTGQILYDYQSNIKHDPASISKLMTIYLVMEAIKQEKSVHKLK